MNRAQTLGIMAAIITATQPFCPPPVDAVQQATRLLQIAEAQEAARVAEGARK